MNFPIDFVVTWVDGSDPNWKAKKRENMTLLLQYHNSDFWKLLVSKKYKIMCINDGFNIQDENKVMKKFITTFDEFLPEKSTFEL